MDVFHRGSLMALMLNGIKLFFSIVRAERCSCNHNAQEDQVMYFCPPPFRGFQHISIYVIAGAIFTAHGFNVKLFIYFSTSANSIFVVLCSIITWFIWCVPITWIVHVGLQAWCKSEIIWFVLLFLWMCLLFKFVASPMMFSRLCWEMQLGCCISSLISSH